MGTCTFLIKKWFLFIKSFWISQFSDKVIKQSTVLNTVNPSPFSQLILSLSTQIYRLLDHAYVYSIYPSRSTNLLSINSRELFLFQHYKDYTPMMFNGSSVAQAWREEGTSVQRALAHKLMYFVDNWEAVG